MDGKLARSARMHFNLFGMKGVLRRAFGMCPGVGNEFKAPIPRSSERVFLRLGSMDIAAFEQIFVNHEYGFTLAREPRTIIDAGANIGLTAVYFARRYPNAKIFCIEPDTDNFRILQKNAKLFSGILPINAALWNRDGHVQVYDSGHGSWGMRVSEAKFHGSTAVRSMKLTTLLSEYNIDQVDLLKIDVEGAECEILQDAENWISQVKVISAELHDRFRPGCIRAFEAATANFSVRCQRGDLTCVARDGELLPD